MLKHQLGAGGVGKGAGKKKLLLILCYITGRRCNREDLYLYQVGNYYRPYHFHADLYIYLYTDMPMGSFLGTMYLLFSTIMSM